MDSAAYSFRLLTVSRLCVTDSYKHVDHILLALGGENLAVRCGIVLLVIGDGGDRLRLMRLAKQLNLENYVCWLPYVSDAELSQWYDWCDAFILPSTQEGCGLVYLEAMLHGKPIIAANAGATPEVVVHGMTGILVQPDDLKQLQRAIVLLWKDEGMRLRMGEAGKQRYEAHFSQEKFQERVHDILNKNHAS